jgi:outer membrane immunogenic protein
MKKICAGIAALAALVAAPAFAADMAVKAPPPPPAPAFSWTGFYIGGNMGGTLGDVPETFAIPLFATSLTETTHPNSVVGGGQIGYNYQVNQFLVGIEADIDARNATSSFSCLVLSPTGCVTTASASQLTMTDQQNWFGTVRGRLGFTWNRFLVYGTGGVAYGNVQHSLIENQVAITTLTVTDSTTRTGWAAGGGIQWALDDHWSVGVEYLHVDLGSDTLNTPNPAVVIGGVTFNPSSATFIDRSDIVRVRLDYRFDWAAPMAPR